MTEPLRFPLSTFQQARFAALTKAKDEAAAPYQARLDEAATAILAATIDPNTVATWRIQIDATEIVCTPPADPA